ncbi:MAG: nitrilase [candidate division Zixibacteria bacterium]|nr:nitrilase [candidate division Zixibacteria bacterium]MDH3936406.1 nitrilase [candidate division Zixibacteria bacterium]MDH4034222.1 nitrilase [candidate division Zixibacteria bacterium]
MTNSDDNLRYYAAACQTDFACPDTRKGIKANVDQMLRMIDWTVEGYGPFFNVKLLVFPEFAHTAPVYDSVDELRRKLTVEIPNEHTERYCQTARKLNLFIQTGTFLEEDPAFPNTVFNTTCLIGPDGILSRYRKVNPWLPWELHTSPADIEEYEPDLFPVVQTEIGNLGVAICYDWLFPETLRQLRLRGAEVLIRVSAYMDPWGATEPMDWWTVVNRCRALENTSYVVASNQAASIRNYPPFSWPGGSMVVDYDGRILAQADPGPFEKVVVAPIDIAALRHTRKTRKGHDFLSHRHARAYRMTEPGRE